MAVGATVEGANNFVAGLTIDIKHDCGPPNKKGGFGGIPACLANKKIGFGEGFGS